MVRSRVWHSISHSLNFLSSLRSVVWAPASREGRLSLKVNLLRVTLKLGPKNSAPLHDSVADS